MSTMLVGLIAKNLYKTDHLNWFYNILAELKRNKLVGNTYRYLDNVVVLHFFPVSLEGIFVKIKMLLKNLVVKHIWSEVLVQLLFI